ncbi:MAG TPA: hypothetical protein VFZ08_06985 [Terriglobia bacterium]|nr:hypothetical protein [Terriglobia bacterium]
MSQQRRKNRTHIAIWVVLILAGLNVLVYAALNRSLSGRLAQEQQRFEATRLDWLREKAQLAYLEKRDAALPVEDRQLRSFLERHVPSRREGFSRAALLIQRLTQQSEVQLAAISYNLDRTKGEPFERLGLRVDVQGPFADLLNFAHSLETSSDFIVVRSFKFQGENGAALGLHLNADLYLMP